MDVPLLRQWKDSDIEPFAQMNSDPDVMRYFLAPMTRAEAQDMVASLRHAIDRCGWGVWAVEVNGDLAGMVGLYVPKWSLPFSPCTEVLWRLRREYWGRGIAHAAASHAVDYGFSKVGLDEIVAFTTPPNLRSIRLMERLGFTRDIGGDFDHPAVPEGHSLRRHILYRKKKPNPPNDPAPQTRIAPMFSR
jgi:RimJ/RimL family protein N-acetyltransferase